MQDGSFLPKDRLHKTSYTLKYSWDCSSDYAGIDSDFLRCVVQKTPTWIFNPQHKAFYALTDFDKQFLSVLYGLHVQSVMLAHQGYEALHGMSWSIVLRPMSATRRDKNMAETSDSCAVGGGSVGQIASRNV